MPGRTIDQRPRVLAEADACVQETIEAVGRQLVLGTPLGIGKPNHLLNAFYRRAQADPELSLTILTALSLAPPHAGSELERRLLEPLRQRVYPDYPELAYVRDRQAGSLPANVRVIEFYFAPGELLGQEAAQRDHASINYSHVARDALDRGLNVLVQLVSPGPGGLSLSCNPDLTLDLLPQLLARRAAGGELRLIAQLNSRLPYMPGPSVVAPETFDLILDEPGHEYELFSVPSPALAPAAHAIGLHASALVRDGGTIQLGIGQLGDAFAHALLLRHEHNAPYRQILGEPSAVEGKLGGREPFRQGLYAASEMLSEGLLRLAERGVVKRRVYDDPELQRALDASKLRPTAHGVIEIDEALFESLCAAGLERDRLVELGVLRPDAPEDLDQVAARDLALGEGLRGGTIVDAGFFLGSRQMYAALRELAPALRERLRMREISHVNSLFHQAELKQVQRRCARFVNAGMKVTLDGAVASDTLDDGRTVSGVGGQHDFATMGHSLPDARFVVLVRATRTDDSGALESNIVLDHSHVTLPDHLRDLVVTEYGVADLRGRTAGEVAEALICVADARCQAQLVRAAKSAGKLRPEWRVPRHARANLPRRIEDQLAPARELLPRFPFGTELTPEEIDLIEALRDLGSRSWSLAGLRRAVSVPDAARPYLARVGLDAPRSPRERVLRRVVAYALARAELI